jgi:hypothetical protein
MCMWIKVQCRSHLSSTAREPFCLDVHAIRTIPSGLTEWLCGVTQDISESVNIVDFGAVLRTAALAAKSIDSSGIVLTLPSCWGWNMRAVLVRVMREWTSLDVSWSAARMMMSVGVIACRRD